MKKLSLFIVAVITLTSCSNSGSGELVGVGGTSWKEPNPYGMVYIKPGSFTMGANDQDANWAASSGQKIVSVDAFWMDETEITNREYKQFVYWVRDSIALEKLVAAEGEDSEYAVKDKKTGDLVYKKGNRPMDRENEDVKKLPKLNWNEKINWSKPKTDEQALAIDSMFYSDDESLSYTRELNGNILNYKYSWIDYNQAALRRNKFNTNKGRYESDLSKLGKGQDSADCMIKKDTAYIDPENGWIINQTKFVELKSRKDFINSRIVNIYPDTLCWIRDFTYSYNEPYTKMYFHHDGYGDYPVVGVTWEQATAFCHWRTTYYNMAQTKNNQPIVQDYRLPTESEWEYAARGGRNLSMYPWGGTYIRTARGCFLANFKPQHGNYLADGWMVAAKVGSFPPNDYGLYDMAGNVAEWTSSAFHESNYSFVNDLNPSYNYNARETDSDIMKRKVIRGGSWKDVGYYLQCATRTYEYQNESKSYIGFRCVRSVIGANYQ
ncbi:MAG: SUMF1/EgtB/PvdO family nonheme iron enzyme [Bacteroidales bacterium]|nr:SUMF1/EgtB/PvdO family nonheme iron enzyme [Paludibacteraceae bacterium]MDY6426798.1 SUMF1/EgtB/PvdO family nonheme iron enzyme [Bacteroidales bacterium]